MTTPALDQSTLHAKHYADQAAFVSAAILENTPIAQATFRLRLKAPEIAQRIAPGQFVMLRIAGLDDPMLGRAFALYETPAADDGAPTLEVVYLVHGKLTTALAERQPGDTVEVWGPLGNGFLPLDENPHYDHLVMVAGGIGQTPFLALGREALGLHRYGNDTNRQPITADRVSLCYGVRTAELLAGADDFRAAGLDLRVASDDGTIGHHGLVTDLLQQLLQDKGGDRTLVACCGPEPMMAAVAKACSEAQTPCLVSLETPMACGIGICFSCVAPVNQPDGSWDYKRTCVEGPIFEACQIDWQAIG